MSFWNRSENGGSPAPKPAEPPIAPPPAPIGGAAVAPEAAAPPPLPREAAPPPAAPTPAPRADGLRVGPGVRLEGKLTFSGTVRIDATLQGSIVTDGVLIIGEHARVDAEIACGTIVVEGEVTGNVVARESAELRRSGRMRGNIEAPDLTVERGALFQGTSRRPAGTASPRAGKAAAAPAPSAH